MALKEKINNTTLHTYVEGRIPMQYRYTYGLAGEEFFKKIKDGKLIGSRAEQSETVYCPPRIFCEDSFEEITEFVDLDGVGVLESFTISCEDLHGETLDRPVIVGFVRFLDADGGLAAPLYCPVEDLEIGMPVKLAFVPKKERVGAITDVYFMPVD